MNRTYQQPISVSPKLDRFEMVRAVWGWSLLVSLLCSVGAGPLAAAPVERGGTSSTLSTSSSTPSAVKASYKIYKAGILLGSVEERFERDGDRYKITSASKAEGPLSVFIREEINLASEGKIGAGGLVPTVFSSTRKSDASKSFITRFNWDKQELVREHDDREQPSGVGKEIFALPAGTQDRLSAMYQFMLATPVATNISTLMTQGKNAERYQYLKQDEPTLNTRAGQFATVHYVREAKAGESKAELWLAKDRHYLPVRLIFTDPKGTSLEQTLVDLVVR
jgi:hypothetical protein